MFGVAGRCLQFPRPNNRPRTRGPAAFVTLTLPTLSVTESTRKDVGPSWNPFRIAAVHQIPTMTRAQLLNL
jgi:hypothetical protein